MKCALLREWYPERRLHSVRPDQPGLTARRTVLLTAPRIGKWNCNYQASSYVLTFSYKGHVMPSEMQQEY